MERKLIQTVVLLAAFAMTAAAQTTVTTSGTTSSGKVPVFNGTSTVTNSPISVSSSNVGIGTTNPSYPFTVSSTTSAHIDLTGGATQNGILFDPVSGADQYYLYAGNSSANPGFGLYDTTTSAWRIWAQNNGNVGIGTTSPLGQLHIVPSLTQDPATANKIIFGNNTGSLANLNFNQGGVQIIIKGASYTNAFNGHGANGVQLSGGDISSTAGNPGIIYGGNVAITGGNAVGTPGLNTASGGSISLQGGIASGAGFNRMGTVSLQASGGSVGIGTTAPARKLHIAGDVQIDGNLYFGTNSQPQSAPYAGCIGGDYAESMDVSGDRTKYSPGDVLVLDTDNPGKILKSVEAYSTTVAGIYSTKPGTVGRRQLTPKSDTEVPMAMVGVVPTKVTAENGAIKVGDLLVSSSRPGNAMKGTDRSRMLGAVIGKAMGTLDLGTGIIEVLVSLQ